MSKRAAIYKKVRPVYSLTRRALWIKDLTDSGEMWELNAGGQNLTETPALMLAQFAIHFGLTGEEILTVFGERLLMDLALLGLFKDEAFASLWAIDPNRER